MGLKSRLRPARAPIEQRVAERITAVDPTSRAIWMQKYAAEERRADARSHCCRCGMGGEALAGGLAERCF